MDHLSLPFSSSWTDSGKKPKIKSKIEGNAIGVGVYDDVISIVLLRWNEIPCRKGKKKQKRKKEQRANKKVRTKVNWNAAIKFVHVNYLDTINKVHVTKKLT